MQGKPQRKCLLTCYKVALETKLLSESLLVNITRGKNRQTFQKPKEFSIRNCGSQARLLRTITRALSRLVELMSISFLVPFVIKSHKIAQHTAEINSVKYQLFVSFFFYGSRLTSSEEYAFLFVP